MVCRVVREKAVFDVVDLVILLVAIAAAADRGVDPLWAASAFGAVLIATSCT